MMGPLHILVGPVWERLTWTLIHFLWQGLLIAAVVALLLAVLRPRRRQVRYALLVAALALMAVSPLATFFLLEIPGGRSVHGAGMESPESIAEDQQDESSSLAMVPAEAETAQGPPGPMIAPDDVSPSTEQSTGGLLSSRLVARLSPYCVLLWLAGVFAIGVRLLAGVIGVHLLVRSRQPPSQELMAYAGGLANRLGMASLPGVFLSARVREAIVVGLWRPVVLLPLAWAVEMTPDVLEAVIAHELAHIRRWDLWVSLAQRLVEALLFYHPAVWWLSRRISLEREMCTDELAVAATGRRGTYAETLELLGRRRLGERAPEFGIAMRDRKMALLHRVRNVLGVASSHHRLYWWPAGVLALSVPLAIWLVALSLPGPGLGATRAAEDAGGINVPLADGRIQPLDLLTIQVAGALQDHPINGTYLVEPSGKVLLASVYGQTKVKGLTLQEAQAAIHKQLAKVLKSPDVQVTAAGRAALWRGAKLPEPPYRIRPGDVVKIQVAGTIVDCPIDADFIVEPGGTVALGPMYGRAEVKGLTVEEAEAAIRRQLLSTLKSPDVQVTLSGPVRWEPRRPPKAPYHISPGDLVQIQVPGALFDFPIDGNFIVEPSGTVALGPMYGRTEVKGLTVEEAERAIVKQLKKVLQDPEPDVSVNLAGWKSDMQLGIGLEAKVAKLERDLKKARAELQTIKKRQAEQTNRPAQNSRRENTGEAPRLPAPPTEGLDE
jgi:protein involved in polysaccharide export with SLBB domain/beta-lactamase regulating signal transducer with metallopeptidase domain